MATVEQYRVPAAATADGRGSGEDSRFLRRRLLWWWVDCGRRTPLQLCGKDQFGNGAEKCGRFCVGNRKRFYGERNGFLSFLVFYMSWQPESYGITLPQHLIFFFGCKRPRRRPGGRQARPRQRTLVQRLFATEHMYVY